MTEIIQFAIYAFVPLVLIIFGVYVLVSNKSNIKKREQLGMIGVALLVCIVVWAMMRGWL